jgi:hypothetical protein
MQTRQVKGASDDDDPGSTPWARLDHVRGPDADRRRNHGHPQRLVGGRRAGHCDRRVFWSDNIEAWGWFYIIVGACLLVTGIYVFRRAAWAAMVGTIAGCIGAVLNIFWIFQYPFASLILITLNVLVAYALTTYGEDFE